jgi:hypothetical protein
MYCYLVRQKVSDVSMARAASAIKVLLFPCFVACYSALKIKAPHSFGTTTYL